MSDGREVILKITTPRILDLIKKKSAEKANKMKINNEAAMFMVAPLVLINMIDNQSFDEVKLEMMLKKLPMKDMNLIKKKCAKVISESEVQLKETCGRCELEYSYTFPFGGEFFGHNIEG